jgi:imidazole glycerol phosphate synthase glutamine amidotransferase subunit
MNTLETRPEVAIVRTGSANIASVSAALTRLGAVPRITDEPDLVREAAIAVLPGVGAFGAAMTQLRARGLDEAIRDRVRDERPLLAICLGMQLLCDSSDESPGVEGLGIVPAHVGRFACDERVPQMGWNRIDPSDDCTLLEPAWMYFAHSFRVERVGCGAGIATSSYGGNFVSALERGTLLACQFHPELSGTSGLALMRRWMARATAKAVAPC